MREYGGWKVGDRFTDDFGLHGTGTAEIIKITTWRHKVYFHIKAQTSVSGELHYKARGGRDEFNWQKVVVGDTCGNCQSPWPCNCAEPVRMCGVCAGGQYECRCDERSY